VDYASDALIIVASLILLRKIELRPRERFLVLATFSASILTILSALMFTVVFFGHLDFGVHTRFMIGMSSSLEVSIRCFGFNLFICHV
jgi:hypothetical protein